MRYSRTGIVAVLLAAEVFIGGAILWVLTGGRMFPASGSRFYAVSAHGRSYAPVDAGAAPHVVIDDPDSRVVITPSTDGRVHVTDDNHTVGLVWGTSAPAALAVTQTADGVNISRGDGSLHVGVFGLDFQHTDVAVPPASFVEVERCGGADLTGLAGRVRVHSVDGSIAGEDLRVTGGEIRSDDGRIRLAFAGANLNLHASTDDGSIRFDGRRVAREEEAAGADYQIGTGGGSLQVSTQDGSIHIDTNGAQ